MSLSATSEPFLNTSMDGDSTTFLDGLFQVRRHHSFGEEILPNAQLEPPLPQLKATSCKPIAVTWKQHLGLENYQGRK